MWSCDVESACAGRYDDVYKMFMNEPNDVTPLRKRREAEEPKIEEGSLMIFSVSHSKRFMVLAAGTTLSFLSLSFKLYFWV